MRVSVLRTPKSSISVLCPLKSYFPPPGGRAAAGSFRGRYGLKRNDKIRPERTDLACRVYVAENGGVNARLSVQRHLAHFRSRGVESAPFEFLGNRLRLFPHRRPRRGQSVIRFGKARDTQPSPVPAPKFIFNRRRGPRP